MPSSLLFALNNECRVHTLSTAGTLWRPIPYVGQEFKRLSGVPHFLWALGGDHQVYVYVYGFDIPIKHKEEAYENERWLPIEGFSARLLPTDRPHFTSADGLADRSIDKIRLPSMAWQWEGDWQLELTHNGQPLDHHGWTYALDFPASYHATKQWTSCVRRRLWTRWRRYAAMNSWCAIAPLHKDATTEPFIDVAVGGHRLAGAEPGTFLVWAITAQNRVLFRQNVSTKSPEGARWLEVKTPAGCEPCQLSVSPNGLVWASLLDGRALVRLQVTRHAPSGGSWVELKGPSPQARIVQLTAGNGSVWALSHTKQVWFRKGVTFEPDSLGDDWNLIPGQMSQLALTDNDQLLAIGADDRRVHFRAITPRDPTGKRWRSLHAPLQTSRASSTASLRAERMRTAPPSRPSSMVEPPMRFQYNDQSHSAPTTVFESQPKNPKAWSPIHSVGSIVGTEVHPDTDESVFSSRESGLFVEEDELGWAEYEAPWLQICAGAVTLDPTNPPNWFADPTITEPGVEWRCAILENLAKNVQLMKPFAKYELAIDTSSWTQKCEIRCSFNQSAFIDCLIELEWVETVGTLTILNQDGVTTLASIQISDITCVQNGSEPGAPRLVVHTPTNHLYPLIRLQFGSDQLLDDWHHHLTTTMKQTQSKLEPIGDESIFALTKHGELFYFDPTQLETSQLREHDYYVQKWDLSGKSPIKVALPGCFGPGTTLTLTGTVMETCERFGINLEAHSTYRQKHKNHAELENIALHLNPRFDEGCIVRNSKLDGAWGEEEKTGNMPLERGQDFTLAIKATEDGFAITINETLFQSYRHRLPPTAVAMLSVWGRLKPFKLVIKSEQIILNPMSIVWWQLGGHFRRIETCKLGIRWALTYDHTLYVQGDQMAQMMDSQDYRVYENQRWNPVSGYTSTGLPTDRYMWSDESGRQKRTRDQVKLLSSKWQWVSDWMIDFHVPGGVDRDGWQYAVDFPSSYHAQKNFTDMVRRRRWYRRCSIASSGPWIENGHTKLLDLSMEAVRNEVESVVAVWAVATGGQVMFRSGVQKCSTMGTNWEHVDCEQAVVSVSCAPFDNVWVVGKKGLILRRLGISEDNLLGDKWGNVEPPIGVQLKQISGNRLGVWAIDQIGRIYVRKDISGAVPEGKSWVSLTIDPPLIAAGLNATGFKDVSVGVKEVWVTTDGGTIARRTGICRNNPAGTGWFRGISGNWQFLTVKAFNH